MDMGKRAVVTVMFIVLLLSGLVSSSQVFADLNWDSQAVDEKALRGGGLSLALDSKDNPHLLYVDAENGRNYNYSYKPPLNPEYLMYASWNGSNWNLQTIDHGSPGNWLERVSYTALAIDSKDVPHIVYTEGNNSDLNYATLTEGKWNIKTIDQGSGGSLAIDYAGNPHISYVGMNGELKYASWTGWSWKIQTADASASLSWSFKHQSLALDNNGRPNIIYGPGDGSVVKWATWDFISWSIQMVTANVSGNGLGNVVLDSHGYPRFTYGGDSVMYASWNGSAWNFQAVPSAVWGFAGNFLALDSSDNPVVTFTNYTLGVGSFDASCARWTGEGWDSQMVPTQSTTMGERMPIALDSGGNLHMAFWVLRHTPPPELIDGTIMYAINNQTIPTNSPSPTVPASPSPTVPEFSVCMGILFLTTVLAVTFVLKRNVRKASIEP